MDTQTAIERYILDELVVGGKSKIDPDESLIGGGVLDSLALLRLVMFIEEELDVKVEDGEVTPDNFDTINDITAFLQTKKQIEA